MKFEMYLEKIPFTLGLTKEEFEKLMKSLSKVD